MQLMRRAAQAAQEHARSRTLRCLVLLFIQSFTAFTCTHAHVRASVRTRGHIFIELLWARSHAERTELYQFSQCC